MLIRSGVKRGLDFSFCIFNGSFKLKVVLRGGNGIYMYRVIGFGWLGVKWWKDLGIICIKFK